jgi:hypothetical protein
MIAIDPPVRILILPLASKGPSTHAPTGHNCPKSYAWRSEIVLFIPWSCLLLGTMEVTCHLGTSKTTAPG